MYFLACVECQCCTDPRASPSPRTKVPHIKGLSVFLNLLLHYLVNLFSFVPLDSKPLGGVLRRSVKRTTRSQTSPPVHHFQELG